MKIDTALRLNLTRKWLQRCYTRITMWPIQRDQANLQWWHRCLKDGLHKHRHRRSGQKKSSMREQATADFSLAIVVVPTPISHELICQDSSLSLDNLFLVRCIRTISYLALRHPMYMNGIVFIVQSCPRALSVTRSRSYFPHPPRSRSIEPKFCETAQKVFFEMQCARMKLHCMGSTCYIG